MFPSVATKESEKTKTKNQEFIDSAIEFHQNNAQIRDSVISTLYNSYNGIVKTDTKKLLEKKFGQQISTQFIDYKLGHSKIKLLKGEFLNIEFSPKIASINPDILDKRIDFANLIKGASSMKKFLTALKSEEGIDPMNGIDVPEPDDPSLQDRMFPKTANEIYMQYIINDKISTQNLKLKAQNTFMDLIIVSECHGVIERDAYGEDVFRIINPKDAIFQEITDDHFASDSPFKGERKLMYVKDIITNFPNLGKKEIERVKAMTESFSNQDEKGFRSINGIPAVETFKIQWKTTKAEYTKVSKSKSGPDYRKTINSDDYKKNKEKYNKDVNSGKYKIEINYHDDLWEGTRIDEDIYTDIKRTDSQIHRLTKNNKYRAEYDYVNFLFGTVDGVRMSLQGLISSLSEVNNIIMHMIVRELKKIKGKVFVYDEAIKPKHKTMKSIFYDITEDGILTINSSADGNFSGTDVQNAVNLIQELDLGLSSSFEVLIRLKNDIEYTLDRVTGINESREGQSPTSQTATGTMQNIEASRSITRDLFYAHQIFMNKIFSLLAEKTKLNEEYLDSNRAKILLGNKGIKFIKASKELMFDDFDVTFTDGGKETEIRNRISRYFDVEINSGNLRTQDVIKFDMTKNLSEGVRTLQAAWDEIMNIKREEMQSQSEQQQQGLQAQQQLAQEDREDVQAHEKELKQMEIESKERIKGVELDQKTSADDLKADTEESKIRQQNNISQNNSNN